MTIQANLFAVVSSVAALVMVCVRCWFLAPTRLGWLFYYPNLAYDLVWRRWGLRRALMDIAFSLVILGCASLCRVPRIHLAVGAVAFVILVLELAARVLERSILVTSWARPVPRCRPETHPDAPHARGALPGPSWHPTLTVNLEGPFVSRLPRYDLGTLVLGRCFSIGVVVGNHSLVPAQLPVEVSCSTDGGLRVEGQGDVVAPSLKSGEVWRWTFNLEAVAPRRVGKVRIEVRCGRFRQALTIRFSCRAESGSIVDAWISRYAGGRRSAFAWRGDMDHYDTVTFQSVEGLRAAVALAARYRIPQTMFLSTRLTLDQAEISRFYDHFGVARGQTEAGELVQWLREHVDIRYSGTYPVEGPKLALVELGNHMHLHYGTDAAADEGNGWRRGARIGEGQYSWQSTERGSFAEQRDNALEARRRMERALGFTPKSWAMPDSTRDENTPCAVEAAGCEVLSDSDARPVDTVLFQPPPHHPPACKAVELTKRYPGDPEDLTHAYMFLYWLSRAQRRGIPVVFMCHQHMRQFAGSACTRFAEYIIRYVLTQFHGDFFVDTVYGIGHYWEGVLCPDHRSVSVEVSDGVAIVQNRGDSEVIQVPVDVSFQDGRKATYLVDLPPRTCVQIDVTGAVRPT